MIGHTIAIHNRREHLPICMTDLMVGHKLEEFSHTIYFRGHGKNDNISHHLKNEYGQTFRYLSLESKFNGLITIRGKTSY